MQIFFTAHHYNASILPTLIQRNFFALFCKLQSTQNIFFFKQGKDLFQVCHDLKNRKVYLSNPLDDAFLVIHLLFASESLRAMYEIGKSPLIKLNDPKIKSTQVSRSSHCVRKSMTTSKVKTTS